MKQNRLCQKWDYKKKKKKKNENVITKDASSLNSLTNTSKVNRMNETEIDNDASLRIQPFLSVGRAKNRLSHSSCRGVRPSPPNGVS